MKKIIYFPLVAFLFFQTVILQAQNWSELHGINGLSANGGISSVITDHSGNIYAAGNFTDSLGHYYVAYYNGNIWSELGGQNGLSANGSVYSICSDASSNIYTAGYFTNGITNNLGASYVAKYNGSTWSELGGLNALSPNGAILSICSDPSGNIYAAGSFTSSIGCYYVAEYNGSSWIIPGGLNAFCANGIINSICSDAVGNIYAAGNFNNGSTSTYYVSKYNGSSWNELIGLNALSANGIIHSICSDAAGNIYAAGNFTDSTGKYYVAKYNGSTWSELGGLNGLSANAPIWSICTDTMGNIYAAGIFTDSRGKYYVAKYNGSSWSELGGLNALSSNGDIISICSDAQGNIYAGGEFTDSNSNEYVAKYWTCTAGSSFQADTICTSAFPYFWNGTVFTVPGTKSLSLATSLGCDSMASLTLSVYPSVTRINAVVCPGSAYTLGTNTYTSTGIYVDTLGQNIHGCDSISTLNLVVLDSSVISYFTLFPSNLPSFWYAINQCFGNQLSYVWNWGDGSPSSIGDTPSHTYDTAGYYTICVTVMDSMGCSATYCDSNVHLFKDQSSNMVSVRVILQHPNGINTINTPAENIGYYTGAIHFSETILSPSDLTLYDLSGRVVMNQNNFVGSRWNINTDIASGVYIIKMQNGNYSAAKKVVITK